MGKIAIAVGLLVLLACGWLFSGVSSSLSSITHNEKNPPQPAVDVNIHLNQYPPESSLTTKPPLPSPGENSNGLWIAVGVVVFNLAVIAVLMRRMKKQNDGTHGTM